MVIDLVVIVGVGILAGLLNVALGALLRHIPLRRFVSGLTRRDMVGLAFAGLGASSLALSYLHTLWVDGVRQEWWEAFHLEIGSAFVILGAVELLIVGRADEA
jgi:hypothetical protein